MKIDKMKREFLRALQPGQTATFEFRDVKPFLSAKTCIYQLRKTDKLDLTYKADGLSLTITRA
jgi:hypothetical protein